MQHSFLALFWIPLPLLHLVLPCASAAPLQTDSNPGPLLIDDFSDPEINALDHYHGGSGLGQFSEDEQKLTIATADVDDYFDISLSETCINLTPYSEHYIHIVFSGSDKFSVSLQQHNPPCDEDLDPYPETWDSVEAARYISDSPQTSHHDIWIPISHFKINLTRVNAIALESFYTTSPTHFYKIELLPPSFAPYDNKPPESLATGDLVFTCKVPDTFAFAIDDGKPELAQEVLQILDEEDVKVTFFVVGNALADETTNLSNVYKEALTMGHEVGLHSWSHPRMEALASDEEIDQEYRQSIEIVQEKLGINPTYFRPPYGTLGARTRQSLSRQLPGPPSPTIVMWTIDVEDWIWGGTSTPEKQLAAFRRGVDAGGDLVVLHYLFESTVSYLREMIAYARERGKRVGTVGACLGD